MALPVIPLLTSLVLSSGETDVMKRLQAKLTGERPALERLNAYYEGVQRLLTLGIAVPPALQDVVTVVNWPRICVDAIEERIDLEGFRLPSQEEADREMWRIWQANDLDEESQIGHVDALVFGRSFSTVGANEDDPETPLITLESPLEMAAELDPRTREVTAALKVYGRPAGALTGTTYATLYQPDMTVWLESDSADVSSARWTVTDRDDHGLGVVPVVPLVNRGRLAARLGVSEMHDVLSITDAAARALTNAQIATEVMATPHRWVAGVTKGDFVDKNGNPLSVWEAYLGAISATANKDAKFGQFDSADLGNFTRIIDHYAQLIAGLKGIPLRYFGQNTANPPSAEGIRADEARLVKSAERKHRAWSGSWERVMRLARRVVDGEWDPELGQLETLWRDPSTPTQAQAADAAVKLYQANVLPRQGVWEDLGYSAARQVRLQRQFDDEAKAAEKAAQAATDAAVQVAPAGQVPGTAPAVAGRPVSASAPA